MDKEEDDTDVGEELQRRREVVEGGAHPGRVGGDKEGIDGEDPRAHIHLEVPAPEVGRDLDGEQQQREGDPGPSASATRGQSCKRTKERAEPGSPGTEILAVSDGPG